MLLQLLSTSIDRIACNYVGLHILWRKLIITNSQHQYVKTFDATLLLKKILIYITATDELPTAALITNLRHRVEAKFQGSGRLSLWSQSMKLLWRRRYSSLQCMLAVLRLLAPHDDDWWVTMPTSGWLAGVASWKEGRFTPGNCMVLWVTHWRRSTSKWVGDVVYTSRRRLFTVFN